MSRVLRSEEEFLDRLQNSTGRRNQELISIRQMLPPAAQNPTSLALRLAPVMAYAHWEGFVKEAATAYLAYLARKSVALSQLQANFQALVCRSELLDAASAPKRIWPHISVVTRLVDNRETSATVPMNAIDTESNLNWAVFENLCLVVGISPGRFWSDRRGLIDDMFLTRCEIAHGQLVTPQPKEAVEYIDFALDALRVFSADLTNAAVNEEHLRPEHRKINHNHSKAPPRIS